MKKYDQFCNYLEKNKGLAVRTCNEYMKDLRAFDAWKDQATTKVAIENTTEEMLRLYVESMYNRGLEPSTIKRRAAALRGLFAWMTKTHQIEENPSIGLDTPRLRKKLVRPAQLETIKAYLETPATTELEKMLHAVVAMITATGMRISEALAIDTANVNAKEQSIKITGKGGQERIVYYNDTAKKHLNNYAKGKRGQIFRGWTDRDVRDAMQEAMREGNRGIHPHQLRHTFATEMLNNGADIRTIQTMLGHSKMETTARYLDITTSRTKESYNRYQPAI